MVITKVLKLRKERESFWKENKWIVCVRIWIYDCHFWTKVLFGSKNYIIWWVLVVIPLLPSIWFEEKQGWDFFLPLCIYFYVIDLYFSFFFANIYIYIFLFSLWTKVNPSLSLTGEKRIDKWKYKKLNPCLNIWSFSYCTQVESNLSLSKKWMVSIWVLKKK